MGPVQAAAAPEKASGAAERLPKGPLLLPQGALHGGEVLPVAVGGAVERELGHLCDLEVAAVGELHQLGDAVGVPQGVLARLIGAAHDGNRRRRRDADVVGLRVAREGDEDGHRARAPEVVAVEGALGEVCQGNGAAVEHRAVVLRVQHPHQHLEAAGLPEELQARRSGAEHHRGLQHKLHDAKDGLECLRVDAREALQKAHHELRRPRLRLRLRHVGREVFSVRQELQCVPQFGDELAQVLQCWTQRGQVRGHVEHRSQQISGSVRRLHVSFGNFKTLFRSCSCLERPLHAGQLSNCSGRKQV